MILLKTISREYFGQNIGFYLFIILFAFGFLSRQEHSQLAVLFMGNISLTLLAGALWALHALKSYLYFSRSLELPENAFLQDLTLLPPKRLFKELFLMQLSLSAPYLAYAIFMLGTGVQRGLWPGVFVLIGINILLLLGAVFAQKYRLLHFNESTKWSFLPKRINFWPNWPSLYYLRHLLRKQPLLFFSSKVYSLLFIIGGAKLYPTDEYDARLLGLSVFFAVIGQFMIGRIYTSFSADNLIFERNFPRTLTSRYIGFLPLSLSLILIEIVFLIYHWAPYLSVFELFQSVFFMLSIMLLLLVVGYSPYAQKPENQSTFFYLAVLLFVLIMFKIPLLCFAMFFLLTSWLIFRSNYFTFEPSTINQQ